MKRKIAVILVLVLLMTSLVGCKTATGDSQSADNTYPDKPVKLVIPTKPGGDIDQNGRLLAASIGDALGETMVVVNQDGGGGNVGIKELLDAPADGYQLMYFNTSWITGLVANKYEYKVDDLEPVVSVSLNDSLVFAVSKDSPMNDAKDLAKLLKEEPETVSYAVTLGAPSQFHAVAIERATGGKFRKIDIGSGADKTVALVSGQIDVLSSTIGLLKDYFETGQLKAIGNITAGRSIFAEDLPTFNEQGIDLGPGFGPLYVIYCKPGTPKEVKDKIILAVEETMKKPEVIEKFNNSMFVPKVMSGEELKQELDKLYEFLNGMKQDILNDKF